MILVNLGLSMSKLISFYSDKGGVGKTTLAVNCAFYLKSLGHSVEFVDLDPQQSAFEYFEEDKECDIEYSTNSKHKFKADYVVFDYPPGATLKHKAQGFPVIVLNATRLSIKSAYQSVASGEYEDYGLVINKYQKVVRDVSELGNQLVAKAQQITLDKNIDSHCHFVKRVRQAAGYQSAENLCKTMFNLTPDERKNVSNSSELKSELSTIFDSIVEILED